MGFQHEKLLVEMLKVLDLQDLKASISGVFKHGTVSTVQLCSTLTSPEEINWFIGQFIDKDKGLMSLKDSQGNTIVHHAAYFRNINLLEALIGKGAKLNTVNEKGNNPLHLAVATKRNNQLEMPKVENLLINSCPELLVMANKEIHTPLMVALLQASESKSDPINVVKVMLDSKFGAKVIAMGDSFGNLPLHIAA